MNVAFYAPFRYRTIKIVIKPGCRAQIQETEEKVILVCVHGTLNAEIC